MMKYKSKAWQCAAMGLCMVAFSYGALHLMNLYIGTMHHKVAILLTRIAATMLCFLFPAYIGLIQLSHRYKVRKISLLVQDLTSQHILSLSLLGVMLVCPASLLMDMVQATLQLFGVTLSQPAASVLDSSLFLPNLLGSAVIAPISEELFFRFYLILAFDYFGEAKAVWMSAFFFALAHGVNMAFLPHLLLGVLLGKLLLRTRSMAAPMLVHGCYNASLLLLSYSGAAGLLFGNTMFSYAVRLLGTVFCWRAYLKAYRKPASVYKLQRGAKLNKREIALIIVAILAMTAAGMTGVNAL